MAKILRIFVLSLVCFCTKSVVAQEVDNKQAETSAFKSFFSKNTEYLVKAQFSIGGSTPLGFPAQIREINSYNPTLSLGLGVIGTKFFDDSKKLGLRVGVKFEGKGMKTDAAVKNYFTKLDAEDGKSTSGYFTGNVKTKMKNTYVTFPVLLEWNVTEKWNAYGGLFFSGLMERDFTGYVYEGVLREGSPIGDPIVFEEDAKGDYDFSEELNRFQYGLQFGGEYKLNKNFRFIADVNWALNPLFKKDFEAITFSMYSIYLNLGFGYKF